MNFGPLNKNEGVSHHTIWINFSKASCKLKLWKKYLLMMASLKSDIKMWSSFPFFHGWLHGVMGPRWSSRNFDSIWLSFTLFILQYHTMLLFFANFARSRILLYFHYISQRRNISNFLNFWFIPCKPYTGCPKKVY